MPPVPLVDLLANELQNTEFSSNSQVNEAVRETLAQLLRGVPLRYSCPLPLLIEPNSSAWTEFQRRAYTEVRQFLISTGRWIATECREFLQWTPAEQFESLFVLTEAFPRVIVYPYYASGDMYGIGASMLLDEQLRLRIVSDNSGRKPQAAAVKGFLTSFLPNDARISEVKANNVGAKAWVPPIDTKDAKEKKYIDWLSTDLWSFMTTQQRVFFAVDLFFGTNYVALRFRDPSTRKDVRAIVRRGWGVDNARWRGNTVKTLSQFLKAKGFKEGNGTFPRDKHIVILWVRFTGKTGGAHVEYDTSFEGLRQLLRKSHEKGNNWAIIVGDKPKLPAVYGTDVEKQRERAQKLSKIIAESPIPTIDLTEFWGDNTWKQNFTKRIDQFKVFELLHYHNHVKHLGARSGNLESLALLGYQVCYFEDTYSEDDEALDKKRMETWHETVGYRRIQIGQVPTRSGKYMISTKQMEPKWVYPLRLTKVSSKLSPVPVNPSKKDLEKRKKELDKRQKEREKMKPSFIRETFTEWRTTAPMPFPPLDSREMIPIFDIRRNAPPVVRVDIPLYAKGFSQQDLLVLGQYLRPDVFFKTQNPL